MLLLAAAPAEGRMPLAAGDRARRWPRRRGTARAARQPLERRSRLAHPGVAQHRRNARPARGLLWRGLLQARTAAVPFLQGTTVVTAEILAYEEPNRLFTKTGDGEFTVRFDTARGRCIETTARAALDGPPESRGLGRRSSTGRRTRRGRGSFEGQATQVPTAGSTAFWLGPVWPAQPRLGRWLPSVAGAPTTRGK